MPSTISWLHLSDLHMGYRETSMWWQMESDLERSIRENLRPIDMILVTGDLTFSAKREQFELFDGFLGRLLGWLDQKDKPLVIPVPGNHDLVRLNDLDDREVADRFCSLENFWKHPGGDCIESLRKTLWETRSPDYFNPLFGNYLSWLNDKILPDLRKQQGVRVYPSHFPGDLSVFVDWQDRPRFTVVGLNSAWIQCDKESNYKGRIEVFAEQLQFALDDGVNSPLERLNGRLNLLLMHHPVSWLSDAATESFRDHIYIPDLFLLCLHGHMHKIRSEEVWLSGSSRCFFQAPSLFGVDHYGMTTERRTMGYVWGQMDDAGAVRVWPFKYGHQNDRPVFIWDTHFPQDEAGHLITPAAVPTNQRQRKSLDRILHGRYDELVRTEFDGVLQKSSRQELSQTRVLFRGIFDNQKQHDPKISKLVLFSEIRAFLRAIYGDYQSRNRGEASSHLTLRQVSILDKAATCRWLALVSAIASGMEAYDRRVLLDPLIQGMQPTLPKVPDPEGQLRELAEEYIEEDREYRHYVPSILKLIGYMCQERALTVTYLFNEETKKHRTDEAEHVNRMLRQMQALGYRYTIEMYMNDAQGSYETILRKFAEKGINFLKSSTNTLVPYRLAHAELLVTYDKSYENLSEVLATLLEDTAMQECLISCKINANAQMV